MNMNRNHEVGEQKEKEEGWTERISLLIKYIKEEIYFES